MKNRFFINNPLLFIIGFIIILTSHSCRKQDNNPSADLASLVDDYHLRYHEHLGEGGTRVGSGQDVTEPYGDEHLCLS